MRLDGATDQIFIKYSRVLVRMSQEVQPSVIAHTWDDPTRCPFCLDELESEGEGFMDHLEESPICQQGFGMWRDAVADDVRGEWSG